MSDSHFEEAPSVPVGKVTPLASELSVGNIFDKRYILSELLGTGSTGSSYKARDILLDRIVVVKILHAHLLASQEALERFHREATITTGLSHQGLVQVYCHGVSEDGRPYLVMDCLEGRSLADILRGEGRLTIERFFHLFLQVVEALSFAHERGVVHRDLKPSNLIIIKDDNSERAVLVDFGIAKILNQSGETGLTQTGIFLGSSAYMSPEQCKGASVDARSDIYSLGCMMFESLAGKPLFQGENELELMYKHLNESIGKLGKLSALPELVSHVIKKCVEKRAEDRYQSLSELRSDLQTFADLQDTIKRRWLRAQESGAGGNRRLIVGSVFVLGSLLVCSSMILVNLKSNRDIDQRQKLSELLKPASSMQTKLIPQTESGIKDLLERSKESEKMFLIQRWENLYLNRTAQSMQDAKEYVLSSHVSLLDARGDNKSIEKCLKLMVKNCPTLFTRVFAAEHRAKIYRAELQPEKGISEIEAVLNQIEPGPKVNKLRCSILLAQEIEAECYFDKKDYEKSAEKYLTLLDSMGEVSGVEIERLNNIRIKAIVALTKCKKQNEADKLISACLQQPNSLITVKEPNRAGAPDSRILTTEAAIKFRPEQLLPDQFRAPRAIAGASLAGSMAAASSVPVSSDAAAMFVLIAYAFLEHGIFFSYKQYQEKAIEIYSKVGQVKKARELMLGIPAALYNFRDYSGSIETAKNLLQNEKAINRQIKVLVLLSRSSYELHQPARSYDYAMQGISLVQERLKTEPDLLWKATGTEFAEIVDCLLQMPKSTGSNVDQIIELFIQKCQGHDCPSLRVLRSVQVNSLIAEKKFEAALRLVLRNEELVNQMKTPDRAILYDLSLQKGQILNEQAKPAQSLAAYMNALSAAEKLDGDNLRKRTVHSRIADMLSVTGNKNEAQKHYAEMEKGMLLEPNLSERDLSELTRFAGFEANQGNFIKAGELYRKIYSIQLLRYGEDNEVLIPVLYLQGDLLQRQNKIPDSILLFKRVLALCRKHDVKNVYYQPALQALARSES